MQQLVPQAGATAANVLSSTTDLFATGTTPFDQQVDKTFGYFNNTKQIIYSTAWTHFGADVVILPRQAGHNQQSIWVLIFAKE